MAQWSVSTTGALVYIPGPASDSSFLYKLAMLDRTGQSKQLQLQPGAYETPRFSRDGRHIVFGKNDGTNIDLWIYETAGTSPVRRVTFGGRNRYPIWSPDGQYLAFQSDREGDLAIFSQRADSSGAAERLTKPEAGTSHLPESWSPRGDVLSFSVEKDALFSLWTIWLHDKQVTPFGSVKSAIPAASAFSPDGRWIAYQTGQRGATDVRPTSFVQPFPATGALYQIPNSGAAPVWSGDGRELFYTATPRQWVAARVTLHPSFAAGNPVQLPTGELQVWRPDWWRQHDMSYDGRRIGLIPADKSLVPGNTRLIQVVLNWSEELKRRVPVK
jgi:dipeptidyl aminopeptidase/acylaminoacyl peptidase